MDNYLLNAMDTSLIKDKRKVHLLEALDAKLNRPQENLYSAMTHTQPQTGFMPQSVGDYLNKVVSGGFLKENLDKWNQAAANSKAQAFEGAPDTGQGNIMDYFAPMGIMAGKMAKTADLDLLKVAQESEQKGLSKEKIFDATGWFKGKDGQWRFEIDDSSSKFNQSLFEEATREGLNPQSKRLLEHPELMKNYPRSFTVEPLKGKTGGSFSPIGKKIELGSIGGGRRVLSHELQHAIQNIEGHTGGGSPARIQKEMDDALHSLRTEAGKMSNGIVPYNESKMQYLLDAQKEIESIDSVTAYKRLLGEVEARNTQTRLDLGADDRRMLPPWHTEDVPYDKQIVK